MKIFVLFAAVILPGTTADFLCFCNFLHPYGSYLYECPSPTSQLIGIIYPPDNTDHYVDLSSPHCVAAFNAQAPQGWVAIYYNSDNVNKVTRWEMYIHKFWNRFSFIQVCHSSAFQTISVRSVYIKIINYIVSLLTNLKKPTQTEQHTIKKQHSYSNIHDLQGTIYFGERILSRKCSKSSIFYFIFQKCMQKLTYQHYVY